MTIPLSASNSTTTIPSTSPQAQSTTTASHTNPDKDEIWSTILKGVASSKMVPTKNVLVLGDPGCGKSTLIHYLKHDPGPQTTLPEADDVATASFGVNVNNNYTQLPIENLDEDTTNTLALGYTFVDVQDEENEAIARLSLYQLGLSAQEYLPLLKFALSSNTIADSLVILALDWTRPWKFMETFQRWINVLQHSIEEICKEGSAGETWSRGRAIVDEIREKVEHYIQTYSEPSLSQTHGFSVAPSTSSGSTPSTAATFSSTPLVTTTTAADQVTLPLPQGCLTTNFGIPIVVVCCKSDAMNMLEQTQDYKDDEFDFIQQTLRCVCMKYGAALFYTSTLQPYTFHNLRQYILHRLLTMPSKPFPFMKKVQVVERDCVLVPSGWDSWGKVKVLREGFDCEGVQQGWDADMEAILDRQQPGPNGARAIFEETIPDPELEEQPLNLPPTVPCEDEQIFFERHFETLQRASEGPSRQGTGGAPAGTHPSVVGPLSISSSAIDLMLTSTEKESENGRSSRYKESSLEKPSLGKGLANTAVSLPPGSTSPTSTGSTAGSLGTASSGPTGPSHEVLANFFQSLLSKKGSVSGASQQGTPSSASSTSPLLNGTSTGRGEDGGTGRRPTISRRDVHKELDRMRQYSSKP
ncbi:hypothetical protein EC973_008297 [Apophysomyces ossiformis]|uniref:Dynein light intermediate chain n=1 Tax=Apophysomyces ossiformis TaxID=679940 RepID=A0A8H7BZ43_9FUNG|nr:hypothetical protein EC973_008297 [Apophysomyces ossiformis]